jgi:uncharacterized protein (DUF4415 family)
MLELGVRVSRSTDVWLRPVRGIVRRRLEPVPPKASIALRVDADVLEWFKAQGPGYQTRINAVLRAFRDASL